jgi:hypothetical protein
MERNERVEDIKKRGGDRLMGKEELATRQERDSKNKEWSDMHI